MRALDARRMGNEKKFCLLLFRILDVKSPGWQRWCVLVAGLNPTRNTWVLKYPTV